MYPIQTFVACRVTHAFRNIKRWPNCNAVALPSVLLYHRTPFGSRFNRTFTFYNFECVPSQNGMEAECLHAHQATVFASVISTFLGCKPVPAWDPSQNGWLFERPQAHHQ